MSKKHLLLFCWYFIVHTSYAQLPIEPDFILTGSSDYGKKVAGLMTLDFNGDGNLDVLTSLTNPDRTYRIHLGSSDGITNEFAWEIQAEGDVFSTVNGRAGDLNNDGFDDLVLSKWFDNNLRGAIQVYYGGIDMNTEFSLEIQGHDNKDWFGVSFDIGGDINNDGFDDLLVSASNAENVGRSSGKVYCYYGSAEGIDIDQYEVIVPNHIGQKFGQNVRFAGDLNSDGFDDFIVKTGPDDFSDSFFEIFLGSATGIMPTSTFFVIGSEETFENFVHGPAQDLNGDGYDDYFIGLPNKTITQNRKGEVHILYGGATFDDFFFDNFPLNDIPNTPTSFNTIESLGDYDQDGFADLLVQKNGRIWIYKGGSDGLRNFPAYTFDWADSGELTVRYTGDLNSDGFGDFMAHNIDYDTQETNNVGWIGFFYGETDMQPELDFTARRLCIGSAFEFQDLTKKYSDITSWLWDFGDGQTSTETNPTHEYIQPGTYTVQLTTTNNLGHTASISKENLLTIYEPIPAGTHRISGTNPDYPDLTIFTNNLLCGVTGDVTLQFANETYNGQLLLDSVVTNGAQIVIEAQDNTGDFPTFDNTVEGIPLSIYKTTGVTFKNLIFEGGGNTEAAAVVKESNDIHFENCTFYNNNLSHNETGVDIVCEQVDGFSLKNCFLESVRDTTRQDRNYKLIVANSCSNMLITGLKNEPSTPQTSPSFKHTITEFSNCDSVTIRDNDFFPISIEFENSNHWLFENNKGLSINAANSKYLQVSKNIFISTDRAMLLDNVEGFKILNNRISKAKQGIIVLNSKGISQDNFNLIGNNAIGGAFGGNGGPVSPMSFSHGIYLLRTEQAKVYHNSVFYDRRGYINSFNRGNCLRVERSNMIDIRNNVFRADSTVEYTGVLSLFVNTNLHLDYNAYSGPYFYYGNGNSSASPTFEEYIANTDYDHHSLHTPIEFTDLYDLKPTEDMRLLNASAPPLPEIMEDINGVPRTGDVVDAGAFEFESMDGKDVSCQRVASGDVFIGTNTIKVAIHNNRSIPIENLELTYQLNHSPEVVENWSGNLAPFDSMIYTFTTPLQINRGRTYELKTSVNLPNQTDDLNLNNNVSIQVTKIPMKGTFLIGRNGFTDYQDIEEATLDMTHSARIGGPITFNVQEGTDYYLRASTQASSTLIYNEHPIIIRGMGDSPSDVICTGKLFRRINNLHIENMTILPSLNTDFSLDIQEMFNLTFENCIFIGDEEVTGRTYGLVIRDSYYLTIKNCHFENFYEGILFLRDSSFDSYTSFKGVIKIEDCTFDHHEFAAIKVDADMETDSIIIHNNQISDTEYGIYVKPYQYSNLSIQVTNNQVYNADIGVFLSGVICNRGDCPKNLVANNMLHATTALGMNQRNDAFDIVSNSFMGNVSIAGDGTNFFNNSLYQNNDISAMLYINTASYQGDYNNYYSPFDIAIASYSFDPLATFADMQNVFGNVEEHSTLHNPAYISEQDLHLSANSPLIDAANQTYFGINYDIDGDHRAISPDIGADEYQGDPVFVDLGITSITPKVEDDSIEVTIHNFANTPVESANVTWEVNGEIQDTDTWIGLLDGGEDAVFALGNYDYNEATNYLIRAWTNQTNLQIDNHPENDTMSVEFSIFLGDYTIGEGGDFTTISEALERVFEQGIDGDVVFNIMEGTYQESINIYGSFPSNEEGHTITFQAQSGNAADVIISGVNPRGFVLSIGASSHFIFQNLSFIPEGNDFIGIIEQYDGTSYVDFNHNVFDAQVMERQFSNEAIKVMVWHGDLVHHHIQVRNNIFNQGDFGIERIGANSINSELDHHNEIFHNVFNYQIQAAISIANNNDLMISANNITASHSDNEVYTAIKYTNSKAIVSVEISKNLILREGGNGYGLFVEGQAETNSFVLKNNMISIFTNGTTKGLYLNLSQGDYIYNTVHIYGDAPNSIAFSMQNHDSYTISNNCLNNVAGGLALSATEFGNNNQQITEYNNIYATTPFGLNINENPLSFENWMVGMSNNNISFLPLFFSNTDLHLQQSSPLINRGISSTTVLDDIDGEIRSNQPDIGADEFDVANCVTDSIFIEKVLCAGETFETYTTSDIYVDTFSSFVGCDSIRTLDLTILPEIILSVELDDVAGAATLYVEGGLAPYNIVWSDGQVGQMATDLLTGEYSVTLTDANDCEEILTFSIVTTSINHHLDDFSVQLSPNPSKGHLQLLIELEQTHIIHGKIVDITGRALKSYQWNSSIIEESLDLSDLPKGLYLLHLQLGEEMVTRRFILE